MLESILKNQIASYAISVFEDVRFSGIAVVVQFYLLTFRYPCCQHPDYGSFELRLIYYLSSSLRPIFLCIAK